MNDESWDLIKGLPARRTERRNALNALDVIDALSARLIASKTENAPLRPVPDEAALKALHRANTASLLSSAGEYRDCPVQVAGDGVIVYQPPPPGAVGCLMTAFFAELESIWTGGDALDAAAFALWRLNWIHPFRNGNGRTARAFAYCCLCVRLGAVLPGVPTVIDQIMMTREDYEAAIRAGDAAAADNDGRALGAMRAYLDRLLQIQIASVD
jgi:Fic family protein